MFEKRLKHMGNDVDLWKMAQISGGNEFLI